MTTRFEDTASAYRLHRSLTNEAEAIAGAIGRYVAPDLGLTRNGLRVLDAGTGDGRVLRGVVEKLLPIHRYRSCEMVLKEYDFRHIDTLLQNISPLLRRSPRLTLFVTNRTFRHLKDFPRDLSPENTVCFDDVSGYRLLAMAGTAEILSQDDSLRFSFFGLDKRIGKKSVENSFMSINDLWSGEQALFSGDSSGTAAPALAALGDEIRAREIYDELAAVGGAGKHFTVTVTRQDGGVVDGGEVAEFFWDMAIVSHAFNRDKDPDWICRNILIPLCEGLSVGGVLVNVHAIDSGQLSELRREIFGDEYSFRATPSALAEGLGSVLDAEQFQLFPGETIDYRSHLTAALFESLELWEREVTLDRLAVSVAYHLQIPDAGWAHLGDAIKNKIRQLLRRDGQLEYALSISGVKRRE